MAGWQAGCLAGRQADQGAILSLFARHTHVCLPPILPPLREHETGLYLFRTPGNPRWQGVSLKQAHQRLHSLARVQLVPGNSDTSLSRLCNHLGLFDLILISADNDPRHIERSWFFIQRIVTVRTTVLVETRDAALGTTAWLPVVKARIDELASKTLLKRAG